MQLWQQEEIDQLDHLVHLAQLPGWWDYVVHRVKQLEETGQHETSPAMFQGLEQKVVFRLQELGFKPPRRKYPPYGSQVL